MSEYFNGVELDETLLKLTDIFTDELFSVDDIPKVVFPYSRVFCDVERFIENEPMEEKYGQGVCYTKGVNLKPFRRVVDKNIILFNYYNPHTLNVKTAIHKIDNPLIIDCHSFSNEVYSCTPFNTTEFPDFIIGHNNSEREIRISDFIYTHLVRLGFDVRVNHLYSGSYTIANCDSIMIEVNKNLYLKNDFLTKKVDYYKIDNTIKSLIRKISYL